MSREARLRLAAALAVLLLAAWLALSRARTIDEPEAEARAGRLLAVYAAQSGQPAAHFGDRRVFAFADEWQFVWVFRPCATVGELRIAVQRSGTARYVVLPDCSPVRGFAVAPKAA